MFPTFVGMNRPAQDGQPAGPYVPHIRGDEPENRNLRTACMKCPPHPWG